MLAGLVLLVLGLIAVGGLRSAISGAPVPRGRMVDIGGRRLRIVCEGPASGQPLVVMESGAFGFAADWGAVQSKLASEGVRSCAYDRAGLGYSDPGPEPRDSNAVAADLETLLAAAHEPGPYILVGHSMAGLHLRVFAARNHDKVKGLVLVEAASPEAAEGRMRSFVELFGDIAQAASWTARAGLLKPFEFMGDGIGLPREAAAEKRWAFGSARHNAWSAKEVYLWPQDARQGVDAGAFDEAWPTAVVTAGGRTGDWAAMQTGPAKAARQGYVQSVEGAQHATLLGERYCAEVVKAIDFVRKAAAGG